MKEQIMSLVLKMMIDFHMHFRHAELLEKIARYTSAYCSHAIAMGNTPEPHGPIVTGKQAMAYKREILQHTHEGFQPLMTIMLVYGTTPEILQEAYDVGVRYLKLIPTGTSTGSGKGKNPKAGVALKDLEDYYPVLEKAQELGMILLVHFELNEDPETGEPIPEVQRELRAIPYAYQIMRDFPDFPMSIEHVTTRQMVNVVEGAGENVVATVTPHHLLLTTNDVIDNTGHIICPHSYCKPIAKTADDRSALREVITSGSEKWGPGTDSAVHLPETKVYRGENGKTPPNAGVFNAPITPLVYAQVFDDAGALDKLQAFFLNLCEFHGLKPSEKTFTLVREEHIVPNDYDGIVPLFAGKPLNWRFPE